MSYYPFQGPSSVGRLGVTTAAGGSTDVLTGVLEGKVIIPVNDEIAYLDQDKAKLLRLLTPSEDGKGNLRKRSVPAPKFEWMEQRGIPRWGSINYSTGYGTGATSLIVDTGQGAYVSEGWLIYFPRTGETARVASKSGDTLTVVRNITGAGSRYTGNGVALLDNDPFLILGYTAQEGGGAPNILASREEMPYNLVEITKTAIGVTETLRHTQLYGGPDINEQRFLRGIAHAVAIENRLWYGQRSVWTIAGTDGEMVTRTMGGILGQWMTNEDQHDHFATAFSETDWNTWLMSYVFKYGTEQKIIFCNDWLLARLNTFASGKLRINDMMTKKYGFDINEWFGPFGTAYMVRNRLFETGNLAYTKSAALGYYDGMAVALDLANVKYVTQEGLDTKLVLNIQANDVEYEKDQFITHHSMEYHLPETHALLTIDEA